MLQKQLNNKLDLGESNFISQALSWSRHNMETIFLADNACLKNYIVIESK